MTTIQAARYLNISYYYLRNLRTDLQGPECKSIVHRNQPAYDYTKEALDAWNAARKTCKCKKFCKQRKTCNQRK